MKKSYVLFMICYIASIFGASNDKKNKEPTWQPLLTVAPNPSAVPEQYNAFFTAAFIYWHARQDNLEYAESASIRPLVNSVSVSEGKRKSVDFGFKPGLKLGVGGLFYKDRWDAYANYTWLNVTDRHGSSRDDQHTLRTRWIVPTILDADAKELPLASANAKWKMHFNVVDLELGRNFFVGERITMRPHLGFKLAFIEQRYRMNYFLDTDILNFGNLIKSKLRQNYTGFGARVGANTNWHLSKIISIFGNFAGAILWSRFKDNRKDTTFGTLLGNLVSYDTEYHFNTLRPVLETAIGLKAAKNYQKWQWCIQAGWEEQIWFSHNQFQSPHSDHEGNLVLHGITLEGRIFF